MSLAPDSALKPVITGDGSRLAFWRQENQDRPSAVFATALGPAPDGTLRAGSLQQLPALTPEGAGCWAVGVGACASSAQNHGSSEISTIVRPAGFRRRPRSRNGCR